MGAFHSTQNFGWGVKWNGPFRFGPTGIFGTSLVKVVHFDRSSHFGRSDRNVPFHLTVPLFCILLTRTITKRAVAWVAVQSECPVPLRTRNFRNFKPELPGVWGGGGGGWGWVLVGGGGGGGGVLGIAFAGYVSLASWSPYPL